MGTVTCLVMVGVSRVGRYDERARLGVVVFGTLAWSDKLLSGSVRLLDKIA